METKAGGGQGGQGASGAADCCGSAIFPVHVYAGATSAYASVKPPTPATPVGPATAQTKVAETPPPMLPKARFRPADVQDLEIWAHDDTVEAGHTYRYRIILSMRNPLFNTQGIAADPNDAKDYALTAETDWSETVTIPPQTYFFFTKDGGSGFANARPEVVVYNWKDGEWNEAPPIKIEPGDAIGQTGSILVDTRSGYSRTGNSQVEILVRDANGLLVSRTVKEDALDKDGNWAKLKYLSTRAAPTASGAVPVH
jgi:hypothetical protein